MQSGPLIDQIAAWRDSFGVYTLVGPVSIESYVGVSVWLTILKRTDSADAKRTHLSYMPGFQRFPTRTRMRDLRAAPINLFARKMNSTSCYDTMSYVRLLEKTGPFDELQYFLIRLLLS